jgi:polyisoprenyl-phosphate glycosyltransferase
VSAPIQILIPVYDDWESFAALLAELDVVAERAGLDARVLVVDDGSSIAPERYPETRTLGEVRVLRLRRNLGHQRAIAIGLAHLAENQTGEETCEAVVVMDGDGEDDPADVPRLIAELRQQGGARVVFAERTRRSESLRFQFFYHLFRLVHWLLTGRGVRFGNFSAVPAKLLPAFLVSSDLWNHYAAAVVKARRPRLFGSSKMNFVSLVAHGLGAISVFAENVATRVLIGTLAFVGLGLVGIGATFWVRFFTELAIPGWATNVVAFLAVLIGEAATAGFVLVIFTLQARSQLGFLPARDYRHFIAEIRPFRPAAEDLSAPP